MTGLQIPIRADEERFIPKYQNHGDVGADLVSSERHKIFPGQVALVDCGIQIAIPDGWVGLIHPRSGLAVKNKLTVINTPGTIDSGYRGRIKVGLINHSKMLHVVLPGDRIAQIVFQEVTQANFQPIESFAELATTRGEGGFGSTGV